MNGKPIYLKYKSCDVLAERFQLKGRTLFILQIEITPLHFAVKIEVLQKKTVTGRTADLLRLAAQFLLMPVFMESKTENGHKYVFHLNE